MVMREQVYGTSMVALDCGIKSKPKLNRETLALKHFDEVVLVLGMGGRSLVKLWGFLLVFFRK